MLLLTNTGATNIEHKSVWENINPQKSHDSKQQTYLITHFVVSQINNTTNPTLFFVLPLIHIVLPALPLLIYCTLAINSSFGRCVVTASHNTQTTKYIVAMVLLLGLKVTMPTSNRMFTHNNNIHGNGKSMALLILLLRRYYREKTTKKGKPSLIPMFHSQGRGMGSGNETSILEVC